MKNILFVVLLAGILIGVVGCDSYGFGYRSPTEAPNRYVIAYSGNLTDVTLGEYWPDAGIYANAKIVFDSDTRFESIKLTQLNLPIKIGDRYTLFRNKNEGWYDLERDK
jgi:hypothetical protein